MECFFSFIVILFKCINIGSGCSLESDMKKKIKDTIICLTIVLMMTGGDLKDVTARAEFNNDQISAIQITDDGIRFTVDVSMEELVIEELVVDNVVYSKIILSNWPTLSEPGAPTLPFFSTSVGAPFSSQISINVIVGKYYSYELSAPLLPGISQEINWEDPESLLSDEGFPQSQIFHEPDQSIYQSLDSYPGDLAQIKSDGVIRHQRVIGIGVYPIQYHPKSNQVVVYDSVEVEITFLGKPEARGDQVVFDSPAYENFFRQKLINYEQARQWRKTSQELHLTTDQIGTEPPNVERSRTTWTPPDPGWRIAVIEEGFYQVTYGELEAADFPVKTIDPNMLKLFYMGEEIAIDFRGNDDNIFESNESFIFFGETIENKYTEENIYWLTFGNETGKRMEPRGVTPGSASIPSSYDATVFFEENHYYLTAIPGDDDFERFMWNYIYTTSGPKSWSKDFYLNSPYDGSGVLKVSMVGYLSLPAVNPDHHVVVHLDNAAIEETQIGEAWWDGVTWQNLDFSIPTGLLADGINSIRLECPNDTGGGYDLVYIDKIAFTYPRLFEAVSNQINFSDDITGSWQYQITGFTSVPIALFDVTDAYNVKYLTDFSVAGSGNYTLVFEDTISNPTNYWALAEDSLRMVESIIKDQPSNLQEESSAPEYILIIPEIFWDQAQRLSDLRTSQEIQTLQVDLQDIYDEFNFGIADASAIRAFLQFAYDHWGTSYVVLMGDGHYDPKNYLGFGRTSFIPPYLKVVDPWIGETAADNRYVTVSGEDTMPDMKIGRLAVNSPSEAQNFVEKIISFEDNPPSGDWQKSVLAVADNADDAGDFAFMSDLIISGHIPASYLVNRVYLYITHYTANAARTAIQDFYNSGALFINYIGHASYYGWASENLLIPADISNLTNGSKTPIILAMTCYDGFFHYPHLDREVLAEVSTRAEGRGAVASWSPTGLGVASGHKFLNNGFYDAIFADGLKTLGEATMAGKWDLWVSGGNQDLLDTYTLFGDPLSSIPLSFLAADDSYTVLEDQVLTVAAENGVLNNDFHPENAVLSAVLDEDVENGVLELGSDGSFVYTPNPDFFGLDSFTYHANDGLEDSNMATVNLKIYFVNDPPVAENQEVFTNINQAVEITLVAYDPDGDELIYNHDDPFHGELTGTAPTLVYTPDLDYSGQDSFTFWVEESGIQPDSFPINNQDRDSVASVTITIAPLNDYLIYLPFLMGGGD